ncbi:helix-turn-helix domain-containing protein [Actinophytocola sp.]|uniref:helix-turn-helix domain-containing protein n=1 Tax=Actinophytocola sp. TaxID=1872138 RepID=UPI003D6A3343
MAKRMGAAQARELGDELRRYREQAGISGHVLADRLGWSVSTVSRVENGLTRISEIDVVRYAAHCGLDADDMDLLLSLCRDRGAPGYWMTHRLRTLVLQENAAESSESYDPLVVPGLLQTEEYATELIGVEELEPTIARHRVWMRMERQRVVHGRPHSFFVHEQALRLPVGSSRVMNEQLLKLVLLAEQPHVSIRVVPAAPGARSMFGVGFVILRYSGHDPLVYLDSANIYLEGFAHVAKYANKLTRLSEVALSKGESREWLAALASEFDRPEDSPDAPDHLAKEQLQRGI